MKQILWICVLGFSLSFAPKTRADQDQDREAKIEDIRARMEAAIGDVASFQKEISSAEVLGEGHRCSPEKRSLWSINATLAKVKARANSQNGVITLQVFFRSIDAGVDAARKFDYICKWVSGGAELSLDHFYTEVTLTPDPAALRPFMKVEDFLFDKLEIKNLRLGLGGSPEKPRFQWKGSAPKWLNQEIEETLNSRLYEFIMRVVGDRLSGFLTDKVGSAFEKLREGGPGPAIRQGNESYPKVYGPSGWQY